MKKPAAAHENLERWMVSYADFMTLMFAVFVVLYSFAMTKQSEAQSMVQGLVQSFSEIGLISSTPGVIALPGPIAQAQVEEALATAQSQQDSVNAPVQGGGGVMDFGTPAPTHTVQPEENVEDFDVTGNLTTAEVEDPTAGHEIKDFHTDDRPERAVEDGGITPGGESDLLEEGGQGPSDSTQSGEFSTGDPFDSIERSISSTLEELGLDASVVVERDPRFITINIGSSLLFAEDSAAVLNTSRPVIAAIAKTLSNINNYIRVRGYTDNTFVQNSVYRNNWELSASRALAVLDELENFGIAPSRLAVEAYGQYAPFYSNATRAGRAQNRRVVIAISRDGIKRDDLKVLPGDSERIVPTTEPVEAGTGGIRFERGADGSLELNFNLGNRDTPGE